jgi:hypothetical protein
LPLDIRRRGSGSKGGHRKDKKRKKWDNGDGIAEPIDDEVDAVAGGSVDRVELDDQDGWMWATGIVGIWPARSLLNGAQEGGDSGG